MDKYVNDSGEARGRTTRGRSPGKALTAVVCDEGPPDRQKTAQETDICLHPLKLICTSSSHIKRNFILLLI